jgi:integrase/recombinase XerD
MSLFCFVVIVLYPITYFMRYKTMLQFLDGITRKKDEPLSLIKPTSSELATGRIFDILQEVRAENVWLANYSSLNTRQAYKRSVGSFIATLGIDNPDELYSVTQAHVIAWRSAMEDAGLSQASIANKLSALSSMYRHLTDQRLAAANPVSGVKRPKSNYGGIGSGKSPALTRQHVRAILDAPDVTTVQGLRDSALLHIYFYTGARCTEPSKLKVKDLGFDREYAVLNFTIKGNIRNTVAIHPECMRAIRAYLDVVPHGNNQEAYMFQAIKVGRSKRGQPIVRRTLYYTFTKYAVMAGVPAGIYPHVARATFITEAYENGVQGESIQRTVGHSSITTTEGYNHTAQKHRESASLRMGY